VRRERPQLVPHLAALRATTSSRAATTNRFLLWPFIAWSTENIDTDDPVNSWWLWPFVGWRTGA
jgi:hypothetical protein